MNPHFLMMNSLKSFLPLLALSSLSSAQVIVPLTGDEANTSPPGFESSIAGTLSDSFSYDPLDPTSVSPNLIFDAERSYHGVVPNSGLVILTYTLNHTISSDPTEQRFVLDLWGRDGRSNALLESRDDDFDVEIFDGTTSLAQLTGLGIDDDRHTRADFGFQAAGTVITRIVITARQSQTDATASSENAFTLQEVRAAAVPDPNTYVAQAAAFSPANPNPGDLVTWNPGQANEQAGLTFGTNAFTEVQAAIDAASADGTVFIDEGDYLKGSTIRIEKALTILGESPETTRLLREETADPHSVVTTRGSVTIESIAISGGLSDLIRSGGGIDCQGTLIVNNSIVSNNTATAIDSGGGIGGDSTNITITNSSISDNTSTGENGGGAIGGRRPVITVNNSTIDNNLDSDGIDSGGGIGGNTPNITVNNSVISNNTSTQENSGGAIGGFSPIITVNKSLIIGNTSEARDSGAGIGGRTLNITVTNSTLTGNTSTNIRSGGAIGGQNILSLQITNCTITGNTATGNSSGGGVGGRYNESGTIAAANNIIAGNSATGSSSEVELLGPLTDTGGNLIGIPEGLTIDDILLPLADNGGLTLTHALALDSPALDSGLNSAIAAEGTTDQRGEGFARIANTTVDIGAFELQEVIELPPVVESIVPIFEDGILVRVDITFSGLDTEALYFLDRGTDLETFPLEVNCVFPTASTFLISDFNPISGPEAKAFYRLTKSAGFVRK